MWTTAVSKLTAYPFAYACTACEAEYDNANALLVHALKAHKGKEYNAIMPPTPANSKLMGFEREWLEEAATHEDKELHKFLWRAADLDLPPLTEAIKKASYHLIANKIDENEPGEYKCFIDEWECYLTLQWCYGKIEVALLS